MCPISLCERTYCSYGVRLDLVMIDDGREEPLGARAVIYPVQQDAWGRMRVSHAHQPLVVCVPGGKVRRGFGDCGSSVRASFRVHPMGKGPQHRRWLCYPQSVADHRTVADNMWVPKRRSSFRFLHLAHQVARCRQQQSVPRRDRLRRGHSMQKGSLNAPPHLCSGSPVSRPLAP